MSEYKALSIGEAADRILALSGEATVIMHARPDADAVGSASAFALLLSDLGVRAAIISSDKIPARLQFLTEGIEVASEPRGNLLSIDVASPSQLGRFSECDVSLMIDHHAKGQAFADNLIIKDASSAAEVLLGIIRELESRGVYKLSREVAYRLYAAMSSDTGGFIYSNASPRTYRLAAELIECGIDHADINHRLFNSKANGQIKAEGFVASKLKTAADGRIAYATVSKAERLEAGLDIQYFDTAIDVVRALLGAEVALFVREDDFGGKRASMRSVGADVASVAEKFNGGGHIRAAGCSPVADTVEGAAEAIIAELQKLF